MDPILESVYQLVEEIGNEMFAEELDSNLLIDDEDPDESSIP